MGEGEGEATVNSNVKAGYQSIQRKLTEQGYCQRDDSVEALWRLTNGIMAQMFVPLVQMLIHSMRQEKQGPKVRMYALAVVPQLARCRPSVHAKLKDYLLDQEYDRRDFERILELLQESYRCLGFACADVGAYRAGTADAVPACAGDGSDRPLAGFVPREGVRAMSKVDLDIHAIEQLLKFPSTTKNKMAQLYFQHGLFVDEDKASGLSTLSLGGMALSGLSSEEGQWSPYYSDYVEYFQRDKFAHDAVMAAFDDVDGDPEERRAYIVNLLRYNVVPEYMMSLIGLALQLCEEEDDSARPALYWDAFAALYIGSLEGASAKDPANDGVMLWQLANNRARQFNTQGDDFVAKVNLEMMDLLFAGQGQLERRDCTNFDKTAAAVIERNMLRTDGVKPVSEGPQAVANAFYAILSDLGWGCDYIGRAEGIDTCDYIGRAE